MKARAQCRKVMAPVASYRCERKPGHKGDHRRTIVSLDATTVVRWKTTYHGDVDTAPSRV